MLADFRVGMRGLGENGRTGNYRTKGIVIKELQGRNAHLAGHLRSADYSATSWISIRTHVRRFQITTDHSGEPMLLNQHHPAGISCNECLRRVASLQDRSAHWSTISESPITQGNLCGEQSVNLREHFLQMCGEGVIRPIPIVFKFPPHVRHHVFPIVF